MFLLTANIMLINRMAIGSERFTDLTGFIIFVLSATIPKLPLSQIMIRTLTHVTCVPKAVGTLVHGKMLQILFSLLYVKYILFVLSKCWIQREY